jgi:putative ABC transport system permease protein
MNLARRNLLKDKTRLLLSVSGVALAVMLILLLAGFLDGMYRQITSYLDHAPGSLVVTQEGVSNLLGATSLLPAGADEAASREPGVANVIPILSQFVILDLHERKQPAYLVGYDPARGGGPWQVSAGREPRSDDEMVFDRILASRHNIALGSSVGIMGRDFTIVGLSDGTTSWMTSFIFARKTAVESLLRSASSASFLLVTPAGGASQAETREYLRDLPGMEVFSKEEIMANDLRLFARFFSAPLQLMLVIAFLVGTLVVGMVIYTATVERQREYGMLKAIGAGNGLLYRVVLIQAISAAGAGSLLGVGLAFGAAQVIMVLRPQLLVVLNPAAVAGALVSGLAMALLASFVPARVVANLAPAEVFRR